MKLSFLGDNRIIEKLIEYILKLKSIVRVNQSTIEYSL